MIDFVAAVPIKTKTAPRELAIIVAGADEFDQPFKTAERRRRIGVQIDHDLVMRDLDILARMAQRDLVKVALSVTTLDARVARVMEPRPRRPRMR